MTKITGKPNWAGPLKMVIRENIPYRTAELGISPGYYEGTWNGKDWDVDVVMPRYDKPDAIPLAGASIFISRTDSGAVVAKYDYTPQEWVETSLGVFDLGRAYAPRAFVRTQQIVDAALDATAAARSVTSATTDLSNEKQAVQQAIANTVQSQTAMNDITARNSVLPLVALRRPGAWQAEVVATQDGLRDPNFAGYGWPLPVINQGWNRMTVQARSVNADGPQVINWEIRQTDMNGAVLASGTASAILNTRTYLPVELNYTAGNLPAGTQLYGRVWASQPIDFRFGPNGDNSTTVSQRYNPNIRAWETLGARIVLAARYELVQLYLAPTLALDPNVAPLLVQTLAATAPAPVLSGDIARLATTSDGYVDYNDWADGWRWVSPATPACRYIGIPIRYWHSNFPITEATLTVRMGSHAGPVEARVTVPVSLPVEQWGEVVFDLGVNLTLGDKYLELTVNPRGSLQLQQVNPTMGGDSYMHNSSGSWLKTGASFTYNARFYAAGNSIKPSGVPALINLIDSRLPQPPRLVVPPRLYGVVGEPVTAYLDNMVIRDATSKYRCIVGNMPAGATFRNGRFSWTPTAAGNDGFAFECYDEYNHLVWIKWIQIQVVARNAGSGTFRLLPFTDSHGFQGVMLGMVRHLFNDVWTGKSVEFCGTQRVQRTWDGNNPGAVYGECYPGTNIRDLYMSSNLAGTGRNPWLKAGRFNFAYGMSQAPAWKIGDGDVVMLLHGTNSAPLERIDAAILKDMELYEDFAAQVHAYNPKIRVVFGTTIPHALAPGDHDGRWRQHFAAYSEAITRRFDGRQAENIFVLPHGPTLHRVADFPQVTVQRSPWGVPQLDYGAGGNVVSTSAPPTEVAFADPTHPRDPGTTELAGTGGGYRPLGHALACGLKNLLS